MPKKGLGKKDIARIQQKIAALQRQQKADKEAFELACWLQEHWDDEDMHPKVLIAGIAKLERLAKESGDPLSKDFADHIRLMKRDAQGLDELSHGIHRLAKLFVDSLFEEADRYHRRPRVPKMCIQCGKREAHFGDVCKRCADESGIRPTGKV